VARRDFPLVQRANKNNVQAARAESVRAVLIKTVQAVPEMTASLRLASLGASRSLINSKYENFGAGLCIRCANAIWGVPGGRSQFCGRHVELPNPVQPGRNEAVQRKV
jgi:hypothetical protein